MKRIYLFVALLGFVMITLNGCDAKFGTSTSFNKDRDDDRITVKGENDKEYESCREACRDGDFEAAHKFLDKLKEKGNYPEEEEYVFNYEVNALVSQNSEEANTRIIYLLNEISIDGTKAPVSDDHVWEWDPGYRYIMSCNKYNIKLNKILDLAISVGNQDIAKKILPLYKEDGTIIDDKIKAYTYDSRNAAQAKYDEAFGEKKKK